MPILCDVDSDSDEEEDAGEHALSDPSESSRLFPLIASSAPSVFSARTVSRHTIYQDTGASISIANHLDLLDFQPTDKPRYANGIGGGGNDFGQRDTCWHGRGISCTQGF
jgi:hypothetical protein